ncbi:Hypp1422 [Branchiostoma lanceolatum]|uniref:Hypp1422 protein n=1 Tax=Branchiostoma lanceolatum TaxID=7740 RepID=A0A8J9ZKF8_BRALA|nr:Hypp1422 [Branchiostoma lanceolatum]
MYTISKQSLAQPSDGTDLTTEQRPRHRRSSILSTNTYSEIKDEDVYDPTRTHVYAEIKNEEVHGISVQVSRVENKKLKNSFPKSVPNVVTIPHGSRRIIDAAALISNPMYETSLAARPTDCTDPKDRSTRRHSSTLSTHSYYEIKDGDVYDPSLTHMYSVIKDEEVAIGGLSVQNMNEDENRERSKEEQSSECLEEDDVVRNDEQAEDTDDDVVTFYAAAAEVALSPSTKEQDTQQQYGTGQENTRSSHLTYSAAKQQYSGLKKKEK